MIWILYFVLGLYCWLLFLLMYGYTKIKTYYTTNQPPQTRFSIIVPFRNEAHTLPELLKSISNLAYPKEWFEVLLVDDESTDDFKVPALDLQVWVLANKRTSGSPKKDAITTAIAVARHEWIVTTDADCIVPKEWLHTLDNYIQNHRVAMIAGPVAYQRAPWFLFHFQQLDFTSLQAATIGSFGLSQGFMCNGANFAYTQTLFKDLHGFDGNGSIASGDDVFLVQKALQSPLYGAKKVHYLKSKNNRVATAASPSWRLLFHQRVRWASKASAYQSSFGKILGLVVFSTNFGIVFTSISWITGGIEGRDLLLILGIKTLTDGLVLYQTRPLLPASNVYYFFMSSILYPYFCVTVALYSMMGSYTWKGRQF